MRKTLSDRAKRARQHAGITQAEAGKAIGVSRAAIAQWENGQTRTINAEHVHKAARVYGVDSEWLASGRGNMLQGDDNNAPGNVSPAPNRGKMPVISRVQAGNWSEAVDTFNPGDADRWEWNLYGGPNTFGLVVDGHSMVGPPGTDKTFLPGEVIHVDPDIKTPANGDFIVAKLKGSDTVTFKQYRVEDGKPYLHALNPQWPAIFDEFSVIGRVVGKSQKF